MKEYKVDKITDRELFVESKEKLAEVSLMINTLVDAQEAIDKCIKIIIKKKGIRNTALLVNLIGDGIISGLDSANEIFPNVASANPVQFEAQKRRIASRLARKLMSYSRTK